MQHRIEVRHQVGSLRIDVNFRLTSGWTVLFGPSGSGKTTLLRIIAGLLRPDHARIVSVLSGDAQGEQSTTLVDTAARVDVPVHRRGVRLAPQRAALFPHLTVAQNVSYGRRLDGGESVSSTAETRRVQDVLQAFQIGDKANEKAGTLSGGEAQRVNLARAVAAEGGRLLLLDEPFTGLDAALRADLVSTMKRFQTSYPRCQILSVTHDIAEAFQLEAEVIKLQQGRIVQQGPARVVLQEERSRLLDELGGGYLSVPSSEPFLGG